MTIDLTYYRTFVLFVARIVLAAIIFKAGINKLPVYEVGGLVKQLPEFLRYLVVLFEIVGPIFLLLGIRFNQLQILGAAMIAVVMLGASSMKYFVAGSALISSGTMYPFALCLLALIFLTEE
ncbi:MAG: DoxX family membrane protein [Candidatus Marinimicrobia bacterium]|nr:DoxX family membrane protein [Candidatus Neomarinimicrobiota bacterium]MBL6826415.1 DoxX family membrane protein [Candidatus Neomarinimicrobiota bacterium]